MKENKAKAVTVCVYTSMVTDGCMYYFAFALRLLPIIPMSLVNGGEGVATGWNTTVTNYDPLKIIANLKSILTGQKPIQLVPWFNGFKVIFSVFFFHHCHLN